MLASHRGSTRRNRRSSLTETDNDSRKAHTLFGRSIECAKSLGLCIRDSTSSDADGLGRAHVRFDMESMDACTIPTGYQTGIMSIIEGDDNILLLTRELADQRFKATKKKKGSNDPRVTLTPSTDQYSIRASFDSSIATLAKPAEATS